MVARFDFPSGGRRLYPSDDAVTIGPESPFLPARVSMLHFRDDFSTVGHRFGCQPFDHRLEWHATHARRRWYWYRLARQFSRHVSLAPRRQRRSQQGTGTFEFNFNPSFMPLWSWLHLNITRFTQPFPTCQLPTFLVSPSHYNKIFMHVDA